jgi:hypothetical protein
MFKKNNFFFGFSLALMITAVAFGALYLINEFVIGGIVGRPVLSESTMLIASLGANIFVLNYYLNRRADNTAKGMMAFAFVCAAYIIYTYFGADLGIRKTDATSV